MIKKRSIVIVVAIVVMTMVLAACNKGNEEAGTPSGKASSAAPSSSSSVAPSPANPYEKHFDISYLSTNFNTGVVEGDWVQKQLEKQLNISIKPVKVDRANRQQVELMYASGETPDFGWQGPGSNTPQGLLEQGVIRSIPREMIETYAPSYAKLLSDYPQGWKMYESPDNPNEQMGLSAYAENPSIGFVAFYRLDWLENLGIKPHGEMKALDDAGRIQYTDTGFTKEEFLNILRAFTQDDPDQDKQKNTYGMTAWATQFDWTWGQLSGYDGFTTYNLEEDGKTIEWYMSNKYKEFLKEAQALYQEGSVDPEFATTDYNLWNEKIAGNKVGFWMTMSDYIGADYAIDRAPQLLLNNQPQAKILVTPSPGTKLLFLQPYTGNVAFIGKNVSDEKLIRILQWFEYMYFDPDAQVYTRYGQEGVQYNWEGTPRASAVLPIKDAPAYTNYNGNFIANKETLSWTLNPLFAKVKAMATTEPYKKLAINPYRSDFLNQTKYSEIRGEINATIDTIVTEFQFNAISGKLNVDAEWAGYLKKLDDAGQQQSLAELNKMPLTSDFVK